MSVLTNETSQEIQTLEIVREERIAAPIGVVFETILEQMGPYNETPDRVPLPMVLEAWPGGRWYRDLGNNTGHLWGHVQSIKPSELLEIHGPLFMSAPAVSHVLYRLSADGDGTLVRFSHRAIGQIPPEFRDGSRNVNNGWGSLLARVRRAAERRESKQ